MNYAKIETPHGTIYSSMDEWYSDLIDTGVNPDIRNVKQMVRFYKIKFSGQITLINLDESTKEEILSVANDYANENASDLITSNNSSIVEESLDVYRV